MSNTRKSAKSKAEAEAAPEIAEPAAGEISAPRDETQEGPAPDEAAAEADPMPEGAAAPEAQTAPDSTEDGDTVGAPAHDTPDTADTPAPIVTTEQVFVRQGGFWAMLLGGAVTAAIGVGAAPYILPAGWFAPAETGNAARVEEGLAAQAQRLNELEARIAAETQAPDPRDEIDGLAATLTGLAGQITDLEARLASLESRPQPAAGDSVPAAEIAELRAMLEAQRAAVEALSADAQAAEMAARDSALAVLRRAALSRILTALDSGSDFTAALGDLGETGVEIPAALAAVAETGVPTQADLAERFPDAARAALALARAELGTDRSGMSGFLKSQLGLRSLSPRAGDDPDAVLSRAEAALHDGRLGDALAEIETLPEAARAALADWVDLAIRRKAALAAAEDLAGTMN